MTNSHERIEWIDTMKAFSIMAVVLNHTHIQPDIRVAAYLVCLPAFFFASGIFTNAQLPPRTFFQTRTLRLLIPFLIFGILSWLAWLIIGRKYGSDAELGIEWWYPLFGMVCGKVNMIISNPPLWFLCCLICLEWFFYGLSRIVKPFTRWACISSLAAAGCLLAHYNQQWAWEITSAMVVLPLFAIGAETKNQIIKLANSPQWTLWFILLVSTVGVSIGFIFNRDVKIASNIIGNPILFYVTAFSVIGFWMSLSLLINRLLGTLRILQFIGQNTIIILCAHVPVFGIIKGIAVLCNASLSFFETTPGCLCLWVGTFVILLPAALFINSYCPFIIGKTKRSTP